jgi:hypothetical protein
MASSDQGESRLPLAGAVSVVALLASAVVFSQFPLVSSRPPLKEQPVEPFVTHQDVSARLWQDPLAVVRAHRTDKKKAAVQAYPADNKKMESDGAEIHRLATLKNEIAKKISQVERTKPASPDARVVVLGVMMFGGPYAEAAEHRRRTRYAVLSGLGASGFVPYDSDHVGFIDVDITPDTSPKGAPASGHLLTVPFEWLKQERQGASHVLVLWLDESLIQIHQKPLSRLRDILTRIVPLQRPLEIKILGPATSTTLQTMLDEARSMQQPWAATLGKRAEFYSAMATADVPWNAGDGDTARSAGKSAGGAANRIALTRTIAPDRALVRALLDEMEARNVNLKPQRHANDDGAHRVPRIAVVSEWDSVYGRSMADALAQEGCERLGRGAEMESCLGDQKDRERSVILRFSYMKGLDGELPGKGGSESAEAPKKDATNKEQDLGRLERAELNSQLDYVRRLAAAMADKHRALRQEGGPGILGIGVVGSDFYDKVLILQALRPHFPQAAFFTTDLDARMLHKPELPWMQNLLVASGFGLQLREELQKDIPPFRDVYQTAVFFAAQLALDPLNARANTQRNPPEPRVFEIGRTEALDLSRSGGGGVCLSPRACEDPHPGPATSFSLPVSSVLRIPLALALGIALLCFSSRRALWRVTDARDWVKGAWGSARRCLVLGASAAGGALFYAYVRRRIDEDGALVEPFRLLEGVSMWPAEMVRLLAAVLALVFLLASYRRVDETARGLARTYLGLTDDKKLRSSQPTWKEMWKGTWKDWRRAAAGRWRYPERVEFEELSGDFVFQTSLPSQVIRVAVAFLLYFGLAALMITTLGLPNRPSRGTAVQFVDTVLVWVSVLSLIVLILWVADATRLCDKYTRVLGKSTPTQWPDTLDKHAADYGLGTDPELRESIAYWMDVRMTREWTCKISPLIYYPFVVMVLMVLARSRLFDGFDLPLGLLTVIGLGLLYASVSAHMLRRAAQKGKRNAVRELKRRHFALEARGAKADVKGALAEDAQANSKAKAQATQVGMLIADVEAIKDGPYGSFLRQDFVGAMTALLGGAGGLSVIEFLFLGR